MMPSPEVPKYIKYDSLGETKYFWDKVRKRAIDNKIRKTCIQILCKKPEMMELYPQECKDAKKADMRWVKPKRASNGARIGKGHFEYTGVLQRVKESEIKKFEQYLRKTDVPKWERLKRPLHYD